MLQVIWIWTPEESIVVYNDHVAEDEMEAREVATPLFGQHTLSTDLGYFHIEAGNGAHLLWLTEDYESLYAYSQTEPGRDIRDLPPSKPVFGM